MGFSIKTRGSFDHTNRFLQVVSKLDIASLVGEYAAEGARALEQATPYDTGLAARSWDYEIVHDARGLTIFWTNTDIENGFPVAIALQYGYATGTGGFVQGRDYINPALAPIFARILDKVWKVVTSA